MFAVVPNTKTWIFVLQKAVHSSICIDSPAVALFLLHPFAYSFPKTTENHWKPLRSTNNDCEEFTYYRCHRKSVFPPFWYPCAKFPRIYGTHMPNCLRIYGIPRHPPRLILYPVEVLSRKTFINTSQLWHFLMGYEHLKQRSISLTAIRLSWISRQSLRRTQLQPPRKMMLPTSPRMTMSSKLAKPKTKRWLMKSYIFAYNIVWSPGVQDILENFSCGTEYLCIRYLIS